MLDAGPQIGQAKSSRRERADCSSHATGVAHQMDMQEIWIAKGQIVPEPGPGELEEAADADRIHRRGHVRINVSPSGTEISWAVFAPNWASLYFAMEWLATTPGPYVLRYFLAGWFEESFRSVDEAASRISQIISKSDVHLMSRVYVLEADPYKTKSAVPELLQQAWNDRQADPASAIDCVFDERIDRFRVSHIGANSAVARLWGETASAFPLISGSAYDQTVSEAYLSVARTGIPRYDHVYAVMTAPDNSPVWIPYQRVILPASNARGQVRVSVFSEMAPVEIRVI
jgi:hypothetical protein